MECLITFRQNRIDAHSVVAFLTDVFQKSEPSVVLGKLVGKELTSILQALGLPGLNGKKKERQIELLLKHHASGKDWNIVFPDKVSHCCHSNNIFHLAIFHLVVLQLVLTKERKK